MALAQLVNAPIHAWPASDSFRYIRDFLACRNGIADFTTTGPNPGPGYEIVDEYYSAGQIPLIEGDWVVFKSNGEANSYPHYLQLTFYPDHHKMSCYLHWDDTTHTGWGGIGGSGSQKPIHFANHQGSLSIHADLDECHILTQAPAAQNIIRNYWQAFGRFKPNHLLYDGTAARVDEPIIASANRLIHLPSLPGWAAVGNKIHCWDTKSIHVLNITAVNEATRTITVANSFDKEAGCWLAEDLCLYAEPNGGAHAYTLVMVTPKRGCAGNPASTECDMLASGAGRVVDSHYDHRLASDIWLGSVQNRNLRGRFALAKESSEVLNSGVPNNFGVAWTDVENGRAWRSYFIYNGAWVSFLEAT